MHQLKEGLVGLGHTIEIFSFPDKIHKRRNNFLMFNLGIYKRLKRKIKEFNPDIIHIHNTHTFQNSVFLACRGRNIVKTAHDYWILSPVNGRYTLDGRWFSLGYFRIILGRIAEKHFLKSISLISPSKFLQSRLAKRGLSSFYLPHFSPLDGKSKGSSLLYVGYLDRNKGVATLVKAFNRISGNEKLFIVGDGPQLPYLKSIARKENIVFTGRVPYEKVRDYYQNAAIVVIPSLFPETGPLTAIEAMQFSLPVIGANVPGINEIVMDGKTGLLFKPGDAKDLAEKISFLIKDKNLAKRMGKRGQDTYRERYKKDKHYEGLREIYARVVSNG